MSFSKKELLLVFDRVTSVVTQQNREKGMLNQNDMTETASIIYRCLSAKNWKSVEYMANLMHISEGCCQLILTQLVIAGLAVEDARGENFKRCQ